ncbi:hypothetical protein C8Q76DRAFT_769583 [Earliella scabrosa]|nr:hypothetical protein C8Q76DRAFT_769583 [Earliella scabrosa]
MLHSQTSLSLTLFVILGVANILIDLVFFRATKQFAARRDPPMAHYTFVADDYPAYLHLSPTRSSVAFSFEDSVRFGLTQPETQLEWAYTGAVGDSNIRLGPNHRFFNTGFSYQLHCARYLVGAFQQEPPITRGDRAHVSRCLNVIHTALEPANAMSRNLTAVRYGGDRTCRSWPALYEAMEENWQEWRAFQADQQSMGM